MKTLTLLLLACLVLGVANSKRTENQSRQYSKRIRIRTKDIIIADEDKDVVTPKGDVDEQRLRSRYPLEQLGYTHTIDQPESTDTETLTKQKFLLEVLFNVNGELINQELQELGSAIELDELNYVAGLDAEMLQFIEQCLNNQALGKRDKFNALNPAHVRQLSALYKFFVRAIDWKTFERNVCFARLHLNGELIVNALLLAVGERDDAKGLIIPAINEILPELYYDEEFLQGVRDIDVKDFIVAERETSKPQFVDMIKPFRGGQDQYSRQNMRPEGVTRQIRGGMSSMQAENHRWGPTVPQKTWQEWRQERLDKLAQIDRSKQIESIELEKLVLPVSLNAESDLDERISYLTHDTGLNSFWYNFNIETLQAMQQEATREAEGSEVRDQLQDQLNVKTNADNKTEIESKRQELLNLAKTIFNFHDMLMSNPTSEVNTERIENDRQTTEYGESNASRSLKDDRRRVNQNIASNDKKEKQSLITPDISANPNELPQISVNNERLLKVNRRRFPQGTSSLKNEQDMERHPNLVAVPEMERTATTNEAQTVASVASLLKIYRRLSNLVPEQSIDVPSERVVTSTDHTEFGNDEEQTGYTKDKLLQPYRRRLIPKEAVLSANDMPVDQNIDTQRKTSFGNERLLSDYSAAIKDDQDKQLELMKQMNQEKDVLKVIGRFYKHILPSTESNIEDRSEEDTENYSREIPRTAEADSSERLPEMSLSPILETAAKMNKKRQSRSTTNLPNASKGSTNLKDRRADEIALATLQQMLVRLKMERLTNTLQNMKMAKNKIPEGETEEPMDRSKSDIERIIDLIIKTKWQHIENIFLEHQNEIEREFVQLLPPIMQAIQTEGEFTKQLRGPLALALERFFTLIDDFTDKLPSYNFTDLALEGVKLLDVKVDKLQTYFETTDADLINLILQDVDIKQVCTVPVARQQRLNHKPFTLKFDIKNESPTPRAVVVRTFLGSKFDDNGKSIKFPDNRRDFLLLDAFTKVLPVGRSTIKRKSTDITWTSRDTTPYMEIYRQVMLALDGKMNLQLESLRADNCRFPQRLLLPRGLVKGLPMQLFVIVTEVNKDDAILQREVEEFDVSVCGMGVAAIKLDNRPLGFPLDRSINNPKEIVFRNAVLKDVTIYHKADENMRNI